MAISQYFYDLERRMREENGEKWAMVVADNDPILIAMQKEIERCSRPVKKVKRLREIKSNKQNRPVDVYANGEFLIQYESPKKCIEELGIPFYSVYKNLNTENPHVKVAGKYSFRYALENSETKNLKNLRKIREERGLTQLEVSELCGWKSSINVRKIEQGRVVPKVETLEKIANALEVSVIDLVEGRS